MRFFLLLSALAVVGLSQKKGAPPPPQEPAVIVEEKHEDFCMLLPDGDYEMSEGACSAEYVSCASGQKIVRTCADLELLRFDSVSGTCQDKAWVKSCGGTPTTTPQFEPPIPIEHPDFDCSSREDGDYAWPQEEAPVVSSSKKGGAAPPPAESCTAQYISCVAGTALQRLCPGDLRYDSISNSCLSPDFVVACGGESTTPLPEDESAKEPRPDLEVECVAVGYYADGREGQACSPWFAACIGGPAPLTMRCSAVTRFDPHTKTCIHAAYIEACGGSPTPLPKGPEILEAEPILAPQQEKMPEPEPQMPAEEPAPVPEIPEPVPKIPEPEPEVLELPAEEPQQQEKQPEPELPAEEPELIPEVPEKQQEKQMPELLAEEPELIPEVPEPDVPEMQQEKEMLELPAEEPQPIPEVPEQQEKQPEPQLPLDPPEPAVPEQQEKIPEPELPPAEEPIPEPEPEAPQVPQEIPEPEPQLPEPEPEEVPQEPAEPEPQAPQPQLPKEEIPEPEIVEPEPVPAEEPQPLPQMQIQQKKQ